MSLAQSEVLLGQNYHTKYISSWEQSTAVVIYAGCLWIGSQAPCFVGSHVTTAQTGDLATLEQVVFTGSHTRNTMQKLQQTMCTNEESVSAVAAMKQGNAAHQAALTSRNHQMYAPGASVTRVSLETVAV